jgi:hypothetical protein
MNVIEKESCGESDSILSEEVLLIIVNIVITLALLVYKCVRIALRNDCQSNCCYGALKMTHRSSSMKSENENENEDQIKINKDKDMLELNTDTIQLSEITTSFN